VPQALPVQPVLVVLLEHPGKQVLLVLKVLLDQLVYQAHRDYKD
jgi:hypothetical protein